MKKSVCIRKATIKDLKSILEIELACFNANQFTEKQFHYYLSKKACIKFIMGDQVQSGYILGIIDQRTKNNKAHIYSLAVLPRYRRKGYGTELLKRFENEAKRRNSEEIVLEVEKKNRKAFQLYCKTGYATKRLIKDYYGKHQDGLSLSKSLNNI